MDKEIYLGNLLSRSGIFLTEDQIRKLITFYEMLAETSKVMNLTTITEFEEVCRKHFLDSLSLAYLFDDVKKEQNADAQALEKGLIRMTQKSAGDHPRIIDVGCGAGFPGLVLAIAFPNAEILLLDSLQKRVGFLDSVIKKLALANCMAIHGRAEEMARDALYRESFDIALSRAVANLSTLSEYCLPFVRQEGLFIAYKSAKIKEEAPAAEKAIRLLGGSFERQKEFTLPSAETEETNKTKEDPGEDYRNLYVIRKVQSTPSKYPRKAGTAKKNPL